MACKLRKRNKSKASPASSDSTYFGLLQKKKNTQITDIPKKTDVISKVHGEIYGT